MNKKQDDLLPTESIQSKIFVIRGKKVLIDRHLAELYGVSTSRLNEQVSRNIKRFPEDFMFKLTKEETNTLVSHFAIPTKRSFGGYFPNAFTEQGVAMLSTVLNSEKAIEVNIQIMRTFARIREMVLSNKDLKRKIEILERKYKGHDQQIQAIFEVIHELIKEPDPKEKKPIGFLR